MESINSLPSSDSNLARSNIITRKVVQFESLYDPSSSIQLSDLKSKNQKS